MGMLNIVKMQILQIIVKKCNLVTVVNLTGQ